VFCVCVAGGRFKKEIVVDGQSYLLLIRDEGGPPEAQFAMWVDAVIFVFSLEDEISFQTVYHYYSRMANYRNTSEIPLVLVGTQAVCLGVESGESGGHADPASLPPGRH
ncbi:hypothetical protein Celaphus_00002799, partial [Cervus elaphus hippelaphus]